MTRKGRPGSRPTASTAPSQSTADTNDANRPARRPAFEAPDDMCEHAQIEGGWCTQCPGNIAVRVRRLRVRELRPVPAGASPEQEPVVEPAVDTAPDVLAGLHDGRWLDAYRPTPMRWAVPDLLPEGLTLLAGRPKIGKSWLALDIGLAVAAGGLALGGLLVEPGEVAYLGLEDGPRRMQGRVQALNGLSQPTPVAFTFATALPVGIGLYLAALVEAKPHLRLIVVDTLARVRPRRERGADAYAEDYKVLGTMQTFALDHGIAVLVVHHTRKGASDDFVESVSGTFGLSGAADAIWVLSQPRGEADGLLQVTGRDFAERDVYLKRAGPAWVVFDGNPADAVHSPNMAAVIDAVNTHPDGITPKGVAVLTGLGDVLVRTYLLRAEERQDVRKVARGLYAPVTSTPVATVSSVAIPPVSKNH